MLRNDLAIDRRDRPGFVTPRALLLLGALVLVAQGVSAQLIAPGIDLLRTSEPTELTINVPADFFGPGSDPFSTPVPLIGVPLGGAAGDADTIVGRLQPADVTLLPSSDTVDIELVALCLVSADPITVTRFGGQFPEPWEVRVEPRQQLQPTGSMTIFRDANDCGTADTTLPGEFLVTFNQLVLPFNILSLPVDDTLFLPTPAFWTEESNSGGLTVLPGTLLNSNCSGSLQHNSQGTSNFLFTVRPARCALGGGGAPDPDECQILTLSKEETQFNSGVHTVEPPGFPNANCCTPDAVCAPIGAGLSTIQCDQMGGQVLAGNTPEAACPGGACCMDDGTCVINSNKCCCDLSGGTYVGDNTMSCPFPPCIEVPVPTLSQYGIMIFAATLLLAMFFVIRYRGGSNRITASLLLLLSAGLISLGIAYQGIQAEAQSSCEVVGTSAAGSCGGTGGAAAQCG